MIEPASPARCPEDPDPASRFVRPGRAADASGSVPRTLFGAPPTVDDLMTLLDLTSYDDRFGWRVVNSATGMLFGYLDYVPDRHVWLARLANGAQVVYGAGSMRDALRGLVRSRLGQSTGQSGRQTPEAVGRPAEVDTQTITMVFLGQDGTPAVLLQEVRNPT